MKKLVLLLLIITSLSVFSQRTCGTIKKLNELLNNDPTFYARHQQVMGQIMRPSNALNRTTSTNIVVTVPVVVHVIYKNVTQNISDAQINSQIAILNNDYRKLNSDFTTAVPAVFQPYGADMQINFVLAKRTPANVTTTGIERKSVAASFNFDTNYYKTAGLPSWDTTQYLNIWVGAFADATLLGFAYLPSSAGATDDGLCITYTAFGNTGSAVAPFNKGRTATHEIGHYFGLLHPWGDDGSACNTAANSDGIADTPPTNNPYFGNPTFPDNTNACATSTNGSMFMNYMDYVDDNWMAFFTTDQKTVMQNTLAGPRLSLLTSQGGVPLLATEDFELSKSIAVYPNPASLSFTVSSPKTTVDQLEIYNDLGQRIRIQKLPEDSIVNIEDLSVGLYYIKIYGEGKFIKTEKLIKK